MKTLNYAGWVPFAWHGLQLIVPDEWNPGKITGEHNNGNVRLDDTQNVRMEIEWKDARGDDRVGQIVDRYIEGLAKNAEKQKSKLNVQRSAECPGLDLPHMQNVEFFIWESKAIVNTLACYSPVSDRLFFIRVMCRKGEDISAALTRVLNSLQDTPKDAPQTWAIYDMICTSPAEYALEKFELKSGHVRLKFEHRSRNVLQIDRLSLAKTILQNRTIEDWYREFFAKDIRHTHITCDITEAPPQELSMSIAGTPKSRWRGLLQPLPFWGMRPRLQIKGKAWADFEANKIFTVQNFYKKEADQLNLAAICDSVSAAIAQK